MEAFLARIIATEFAKAYAQIINQFTASFIKDYCTAEGNIDWEEFVRFNSSSKS